jgi:uncharacterized protein YeaO (DUF488 family)
MTRLNGQSFKPGIAGELRSKNDLIDDLRAKSAKGKVTLLYGAKDEVHNEAVVLESLLQAK